MKNNLYGIGQRYEQIAAKRISRNGAVVIPVCLFQNNTGGVIDAPMLIDPEGRTQSPDLYVLNGRLQYWVEVKHKTGPVYFFKRLRWEHGVDYTAAKAYLKVQQISGKRVYLVIHEDHSPITPDIAIYGFNRDKAQSDLQGPETWLAISLNKAFSAGNICKGHDSNMDDDVGLYWPRSAMKPCFIRAPTVEVYSSREFQPDPP